MRTLRVELAERGYPVHIGTGCLERVGELIGERPVCEKAVVLCDAEVADASAPWIDAVTKSFASAGLETLVMPARGEQDKTPERVGELWRALGDASIHRNDLVVALGGGASSDLAGFVAATYNRGVPWVVVPTTLLAMVDASIGGKTGVNLPHGKNLVGAFHQPLAVIADVTTLRTLPDRQVSTGMAEVLKHGFIARPPLIEDAMASRDAIFARDPTTLERIVADAAAVKVAVVSADERERGPRVFLNYGHTVGHALETLHGYDGISHGEAVAIGMMFVAHLSAALGYRDLVGQHRDVLEAFGLPTSGARITFDDVASVLRRDKKYDRGVRFVVLRDLGEPELVGDISEDVLRSAFERVR